MLKEFMKDYFLYGRMDWTCYGIGKPEKISVYGVFEKCFEKNKMLLSDEAVKALTADGYTYIGGDFESIDRSCYMPYLVDLYDGEEENVIKILDRSGIPYLLVSAKQHYIIYIPYYNMSLRDVETDLMFTDKIKIENIYD